MLITPPEHGVCRVKLGVNTETNQKVAIKILKDVFNKFISNEIETLSKINHPHIVNLVEFLPNVDYVKKNGTIKKVTAIVLELAPGGEVFEFLFRTGRFSEEVARFFFRNLIESNSTTCTTSILIHRLFRFGLYSWTRLLTSRSQA